MIKNYLGVAIYKIDDKFFPELKIPLKKPEITIYDYHHQIPSLSESLGSDALFSIPDVDCRLGDRPVPVGT